MSNQDSVPSVSGLQDVVQGKLELMSSLEPSVKCGCSLDDIVLDEKYLLFFSIVNQSSNAVVITDVNKNIVYVNQKFQQISGYSRGEVIGKNPRILTSKKTSPATYADMHKTLDAKQQWSGEFINRHKDGSEYIEQVVISPILNTRGDVVCYLAEKKDITLQKEAEARIQRLTHFDSLTGVPNRDYFLDQAGKMTDLLHSADNHFSLLFIDLNNFKALNDTYGHLHGDKALQIAAKRISGVIGPDDFLARVGGDEFVIVHNNATEGSTRKLARRLADDFSQPFLIDDKENQLGVSIGSACWPVDGTSIEQLLARADLAMYSAKTQDQSYCCYTRQLGEAFEREYEIARKLSAAVQENSLSLVYQPKFDLNSQQISGLEALLRWHDSELGAISPAEFIPIAEKHKLMSAIGSWVITEVCRQIRSWQRDCPSFDLRVAINISVQQIDGTDFYNQIMVLLFREKVSPSQLELEVTESVLISDPDRIMTLFSQLRRAGFHISIDDFGTGYSSMSYLTRLQANILKIDRSFVTNITSKGHGRTVVKAIIDLGHSLGLKIIAEGVETDAQLRILQQLGCDVGQGYLFCRPITASELLAQTIKTDSKEQLLD